MQIICISVKNGLYQIVSFNDFEPIKRILSFECNIFENFKAYEPNIRKLNMYGLRLKKQQKKLFEELQPTVFETLVVETKGFAGHYRVYDKKYNYSGEEIATTTFHKTFIELVESVRALAN